MRIAPVPHFWANVSFYLRGDYDQAIEATFKAKFRRLTQDELERLMARIHAARVSANTTAGDQVAVAGTPAPDQQGARPITDQEIVDSYLLDWKDMVDDHDEPLPFNPDNLARALQVLGCRAATVRAFIDAHIKAPEKNSGQPHGGSTGG